MADTHVTGWRKIVGILLLVLVSISFVFLGLSYYIQSMVGGGDRVATVAGQAIRVPAFQRAWQRALQENPDIAQSNQKSLMQQQVLASMMQRLLLKKVTHQARFVIPDNLLRESVQQMPVFLHNGQFSRQRFAKIAASNGESELGLLELIREDLCSQQWQQQMAGMVFTVPALADKAYQLFYQRRSFGYFLIDPKTWVASEKPSSQAILKYYQQHQETYRLPARVQIDYVRLQPAQIEKKLVISAQAVTRYYQRHQNALRSPARWRVQQLTVKSAKGSGSLSASRYAQALKSGALTWRDVERRSNVVSSNRWLQASTLPVDWQQALQQTPDGGVTTLLSGQVILRRVQYDAGHALSLSAAQPRIIRLLRSQQLSQRLSDLNSQMGQLAINYPNRLQPIAKQLGLTVQRSGWFSQDKGADELTGRAVIRRAAFDHAVLRQSANSAPIALENGDVVVLRVHQVVASHVPALSQVENDVSLALRRQMAGKSAQALATKLSQALAGGQAWPALAKRYNLHWSSHDALTAEAQHLPVGVMAAVFQLSMQNLSTRIQMTPLPSGKIAVVQLRQVLSARTPESTSVMENFNMQWMQTEANSLRQLYLQGLVREASIKVNEKRLQSL